MPPIPPQMGSYDPAWLILNAVRSRLKSQLKSLYPTSGAVLDESQPGTQQAFNNGFRKLQDSLCDAGAERFSGDALITGIPPVQNFDPAVLNYISWTENFNGLSASTQPVLPSNLIIPLWMSERQTTPAGGNAFSFGDVDRPNMACRTDGLRMGSKTQGNGQWEWREDKIWYPGSTLSMDFRIRYRGYIPDIIDVGTTRWFQQPVQIMRCSDALSWWVCFEFAASRSREDPNMLEIADSCKEEAVEATKKLVNRDVMKNERVNQRKIPYGGGQRGNGWGGWR